MESLEAHKQRVNRYSKQAIKHTFDISNSIFLRGGEQVFFMIREEKDCFSEEIHMEV